MKPSFFRCCFLYHFRFAQIVKKRRILFSHQTPSIYKFNRNSCFHQFISMLCHNVTFRPWAIFPYRGSLRLCIAISSTTTKAWQQYALPSLNHDLIETMKKHLYLSVMVGHIGSTLPGRREGPQKDPARCRWSRPDGFSPPS